MNQSSYPEIASGKEIFQPISLSGEKAEFYWTLKPGGAVPGHIHKEVDEHFEVLEGSPTFKVDGKLIHAKPGDKVIVPKKIVHGISNRSKENIRCLVSYQPASDQGKIFDIALYMMKEYPDKKPNMLKVIYVFIKMKYKELSSAPESSPTLKAVVALVLGTIKLIGDIAGWQKEVEKYRAQLN